MVSVWPGWMVPASSSPLTSMSSGDRDVVAFGQVPQGVACDDDVRARRGRGRGLGRRRLDRRSDCRRRQHDRLTREDERLAAESVGAQHDVEVESVLCGDPAHRVAGDDGVLRDLGRRTRWRRCGVRRAARQSEPLTREDQTRPAEPVVREHLGRRESVPFCDAAHRVAVGDHDLGRHGGRRDTRRPRGRTRLRLGLRLALDVVRRGLGGLRRYRA